MTFVKVFDKRDTMTNKKEVKNLILALMQMNGIKSLEDLGEKLGTPKDRNRQAKYKKAKTALDSLDYKHLLMFAGLFGVPYEKLKNADSSLISSNSIGNSVNIGDGNSIKNSQSTELSPQEFVKLDEQQRKDYLEFLKITQK